MNTEFEVVKNSFLSKVVDYGFAKLTEEELNQVLIQNIRSSLSLCEFEDIIFDEMMEEFNCVLTPMEVESISLFMVYSWLIPKVNNVTMFEYRLSSNDYKRFSEQAQLEQMQKAKNEAYSMAKYYANKINNKKALKGLMGK